MAIKPLLETYEVLKSETTDPDVVKIFPNYLEPYLDSGSDCSLDDLCDLNGIELESELCSEIDKKYLFKLPFMAESETDKTDSASDSSFLSGNISEVEA